jgi:branched-chain amino acid transport system permease protein
VPSASPKPWRLRRPASAALGASSAAGLAAALALAPLALGSQSYALHILMSVFLFATLGHAWNLMAGYAGLLTFGQQVFIGLGGFTEALIYYYAPVSIWVAWLAAGLVSVAFAWLLCLPLRSRGARRRTWIGVAVAVVCALGYEFAIARYPAVDVFGSAYVRRVTLLLLIFLGALPLLRLRGPYFAIATWLIAEAVATVFNGWNVAGAGGGMQIRTDITQVQLYYVALAVLVATTALIWLWMRSTQGLALTAIRDDEDAARSCGVDVDRVKATVFMASALMTGLVAGLYFIDVIIITPPSAFSISWSSYIVFVAVAGGMGTVAGPIVGAVLFILIERLLGAAAGQGLLALGVLSILLMLLLPRGVMGLVADLTRARDEAEAAPDTADPVNVSQLKRSNP